MKFAEDGSDDNNAWKDLVNNRPSITFSTAPDASWFLSPDEFWRIFTAPSLKSMLHYSVNSYNNKAVVVSNPLAEAFEVAKAAASVSAAATPPATGEASSEAAAPAEGAATDAVTDPATDSAATAPATDPATDPAVTDPAVTDPATGPADIAP